MHGGRSLVGPALPGWIDGRRSKYLPKRLLADYHASLNDPEKLALDAELAVIDARMNDVLSRVDSGESSRLWGELRATYKELETARKIGDTAGLQLALLALGDLIKAGHADWAAWADVRSLIRERKGLVESERKRLVEMQQVIAVDQAMALMAQLIDAVREVADDRTLRAVTDRFVRITGISAHVAADGDSERDADVTDVVYVAAGNGR